VAVDLTFEQHVVIPNRSLSEVFDYVSDFARAAEWRVEVVGSSMSPPAPMALGSRLREVSRIAGREVVTESVVDEISAPTRWSFAHVSGPLPVRGDYTFASGPDGVGVTYRLDVRLTGLWALAAPYLRWSGRRLTRRSLGTLAQRLASAD
jgi:Polyketide cyclase / dehydrase and lipid transport